MKAFPLFSLALLSLVLSAISTKPGLETCFTQGGLNVITDHAVETTKEAMKKVELPGYSGNTSIPLVGKVKWVLGSLKWTKLDFKNTDVKVKSDYLIVTFSAQCELTAGLEISVKKENKNSQGSIAFSATISQNVSFTDKNGEPEIDKISTNVNLAKVELKIKANLGGKLNKLLKKAFQKPVKAGLEKSIEKTLDDTTVMVLNRVLKNLGVVDSLRDPLVLDLSLSESPKLGRGVVSIFHKGNVYNKKTKDTCPGNVCKEVSLPSVDTKKHMQWFLSEYTANSYGYAAHKAGHFDLTVTPPMVPKTTTLKLNTQSLAAYLPDLNVKHPNKDLSIRFEATSAPQFSFNNGGIKVQTNVKVSLNLLGGANVAVFTSTFESDVLLSLKGWSPIPSFTNIKTKWIVTSSTFTVDMPKLQPGIDLATKAAVTALDFEFVGGFILPFPYGYLLQDTAITVKNDVVSIEANITPGHP